MTNTKTIKKYQAILKYLLNDCHRQSSTYVIIQPSLLRLSLSRKCCEWRVLFCEPFQACHLQGPRSHQRSCCCATSFPKKSTIAIPPPRLVFMLQLLSKFFSKSSADHLLVHLLVHQSDPPPPNVSTSVVLILSPLVIQLGPLWSSPSECKSMFGEVILHGESVKD